MSNSPHTTLEKLTKLERGIRVDFYWLGDRFSHTISAMRDGEATVVWRSVDDNEFGPVYQELHEQTTDDGRTILFLNGASAGAHWSASVEFDEVKRRLHFDVAARITAEPLQRPIEYRREFEDEPLIQCGGDRMQAEEDARLVRFRTFSSRETPPVTQRCYYMFF